MWKKPDHVEHGGEVRADTPDKWSDDDTARQEEGLPKAGSKPARENDATGRVPVKGTDTPATTDVETSEREKGKRTTM